MGAGRQRAEHRNPSFWKDAGKRSGPGRGPAAAAYHGEVGLSCAEQGTASTRVTSRRAGEDLLGTASSTQPMLNLLLLPGG